jgi:pimeloyl-ACP methyl ester carboxylesterase
MKTKINILSILLVINLVSLLNAQNITSGISEDSISITRGDVTYSGTFSKPAGEGSYPLVILVSGMGMQDRDWSFMGGKYKIAKIISEYLNQNGIAVYRYDDRGFGKSTGTPEMITSFEELSEDIYQAVATLKTRHDVGKVGLLGHSLGGILSIMAASNHPDIDFIITLSGSYQNGGEIILEQARTLKRWRTNDNMTDEEVIANGEKFARAEISFSNGGEGLETMKEILSDLIHYQIRSLSAEDLAENLKEFKDTTEFINKSFEGALEYYTSPHQKSFTAYDPSEGIKKVTCPILILFGENDNHVTVKANMPKVGIAISETAFTDITIRIIPKADHGYSAAGYIENGEMVPGVTDFIANWINFRQ